MNNTTETPKVKWDTTPKLERNAEIIALYLKGDTSYSKLARKFDLTSQRIGFLLKKYKERNARKI